MKNLKVVGKIQVATENGQTKHLQNIEIISPDGSVRAAVYGDFVYEGEQIASTNPDALFQIKYLALTEPVVYEGVFTVLTDGSVEGDNAVNPDTLLTAAGDGSEGAGSTYIPDKTTADDVNVLDRGENGIYGDGIINFGIEGVEVEGADIDITPPVITSSNVVIYDENATDPVITLLANDTNQLTYSIEEGIDSALFTIDSQTGVISFVDSPNFENPQDLSADNEYNINVTVTDTVGNFTTQALSINVNNLNETPVSFDDEGTTAENDAIILDVIANDTDQDAGDTLTITKVSVDEGQGSVSFTEDNKVLFTPGSDFDYLNNDEETTITLTYTVVDSGGLESTSEVLLKVTGTNDVTIIKDTTTAAGETAEDVLTSVTGSIDASDLDTTDNALAYSLNTENGTYGNISIDSQSGDWVYTIDNTLGSTQGLNNAQEETETFTVTVTTQDGETITQDISVNVLGTNDIATIQASSVLEGTVQEDIETVMTQGTVNAFDIDVNDSNLVYSIAETTGLYGNIAIDATTGDWVYTIDNTLQTTQSLNNEQTEVEKFTVKVTTPDGEVISQDITVNVVGSDDMTYILDSTTAIGVVSEDAPSLVTSGSINAMDIDYTDNALMYQIENPAGKYGDILIDSETGNWVYKINNSLEATQALQEQQMEIESFDVIVETQGGEGIIQPIIIEVTGTNDAPTIKEGESFANLDETDSALSIGGTLIVGDLDLADTVSASVTSVNISGTSALDDLTQADILSMLQVSSSTVLDETQTVNNLGWSFNSGEEAFNSMALGETLIFDYNIQVVDSSGASTDASIQVTITGTNDGPVAVADFAGNGLEDANLLPTVGSAMESVMTVDAGETVAFEWNFSTEDYDPFNDFSFVVVDGVQVQLLSDVLSVGGQDDNQITTSGTQTFTYTFTEAGNHTVAFGVSNSVDGAVSSTLDVTYISGGSIIGTPSLIGNVVETDGVWHLDTDNGANATALETFLHSLVYENDTAIIDVLANDTDVDHGATFTLDSLADDASAVFSIVDNKLVFTPGTEFDYLAVGESTQIAVEYTMSDENGAESSAVATLTITGTNDSPIVGRLHVETGEVIPNISQTFDGQLSAYDVDATDIQTFGLESTNQRTTIRGGYEDNGTPNTVFNVGTQEDPIYAKVISSSGGLDNLVLDSITVDADGAFHVTGDFNALADGETATIRFRYSTVDDSGVGTNPEHGESDESNISRVELTIMGTNDAPVAVNETITKVADVDNITVDPNSVDDGMGSHYSVVQDGNGDYGINQDGRDWGWGPRDSSSEIDSLGDNEQIVFTFAHAVTSAEISYTNFDSDDNASYRLYMNGDPVSAKVYHEPDGTLTIPDGVTFNAIVIYAEEADGNSWLHWTDFQVSNVLGSYELDTVHTFVIDDATLLANDIDVDSGDSMTLSLDGVDPSTGQAILYAGTTAVGTVELDGNGDILVSPTAGIEVSEGSQATFDYTITDGSGETSGATASVNITLGALEDVTYSDVPVDNVLIVDGTLDLSGVENISVIQLDNDNALAINSISVEDVIHATDADNTLMIHSLDGGASDQVQGIDSSFTQGNDVNIDGNDYYSYTAVDSISGDVTLLIEIEPLIPDAV